MRTSLSNVTRQQHPNDNLEMLGHRDFDKNHNWTHNNTTTDLHETTTSFIDLNRLSTQQHEDTPSFSNSPDSSSPTQHIAFDLFIYHFSYTTLAELLKMVIQGTAGIEKSYLKSCLKYAL